MCSALVSRWAQTTTVHLQVSVSRAPLPDSMARRLWLCVCICFTFWLVQSTAGAADAHRKHENDVAHHHISSTSSARPGSWNQDKPKRLFSRTRYLSAHRLQALRPKPEPVGAAPAPVRRCAGLMESCSGRTPCCEPCASCHCRLFNTICHCWRLGGCPRKT